MNINEFIKEIQTPLFVLLSLMVVDFVFGVILALVKKRFSWDKLTGYLTSDFLPILAWFASAYLAKLPHEYLPSNLLEYIPNAIYATVALSIGASILAHFSEIGVLRVPLAKIAIRPKGEEPNG